MSRLGHPVIYTVHDEHRVVANAEGAALVHGSIHHGEMTEFAGIVGRVHASGNCDIRLFVPNHDSVWVDDVPAGTGGHTFRLFGHEPEELEHRGSSEQGDREPVGQA